MTLELTKYFPSLSNRQIEHFNGLQAVYTEWNDKINVISRKDIEHLYVHHVLHSLAIAKVVTFLPGAEILDVGTGGGFPAVPLAIMFPESKFTAVDSVGKKIKVVSAVIEAAGITNLTALNVRAEELPGSFDFVTGRSVADLTVFTGWVARKVKQKSMHALPNGIICLKGGDLNAEIKEVRKKFRLSPLQVTEYDISDFFSEEYFETKKVVYIQI